MFESSFEKRVKDLAQRSGLKVADLNSSRAKMLFTVKGNQQTLWIYPYESVWEFSCPSVVVVQDADIIPKPILLAVLERNSEVKRGFWCIERIGEKKVLEFMHNIPETLLTPEEFNKICWSIVEEVERLEHSFRELVRRLL